MAAATEKQITDLEKALTEQFYFLVQGATFRVLLARKYGLDSAEFKKYNSVFVPLVRSWVLREVKYERELVKKNIYGIIASGDITANDFFISASLPKLTAAVKKWNKDQTTSGIGFIPLLIWAAIAIYGLWTAKEVTDDLTTTTEEKADLLKTTQQTAKDLGLTPEQAAGLISQTQAEASQGSGLGDTIKWLAIIGAGAFILPQVLKSTSTNK